MKENSKFKCKKEIKEERGREDGESEGKRWKERIMSLKSHHYYSW